MTITLTVSEEQLEEIVARKVEECLAQREGANGAADPWLRGAPAIAEHLGCTVSRVYNLRRRRDGSFWPVKKDGALVAKKADLDKWIEEGGGRSL